MLIKNSLFLFLLLFINNIAKAEIFNFNSKNIKVLIEENKILAGKGVVTSSNGLKVFANNFEYLKDKNILKSSGNGKAINESRSIEINFENAIFDGNNNTISASGNIEMTHFGKNILIIGETLFYDDKNKLISSKDKTTISDSLQNTYKAEAFTFEIDNEIIKFKNLEFIDNENNILTADLAYINVNSGKLFGKDLYIELNNFSNNDQNEPRLKGRSFINDVDFSEINKGVFTTCKKNDNCPPWELSSKKITYDKKKKIINYDDAILKVYDVPIMYFPKFFHN